MILRLAAWSAFVACVMSFASSQAVPQRIRVSENVSRAFLVKKVDPVYPPLAKQARIQGTVILQVEVDKSGNVENVQLFSGHPMLATAAIDAVKRWKYKPYLLNGQPVEVETRVTVNFALPDTHPAEGVAGDMPGGFPPDAPSAIKSISPLHALRPGLVRVPQGVMAERVISKVPPDYPPDAKQARIQGTVVLRVNIDKEGNVSNIQLISGHPILAPAAIGAVKQWKYKPYLLNGAPIEVETQVTVNFTLAR